VLSDKGLVESGPGYGSKFAAVAPDRALPALIAYEELAIAQRKDLAGRLGARLATVNESADGIPEGFLQVLRNPRLVGERLDRLQLAAEHSIEIFSKAPVVFSRPGNPTEDKVLRRGLTVRSIYERAILDDPNVKPFLSKWIAGGEQARVYEGELPHKLAIFDAKTAVMPLATPSHLNAVFIHHRNLVQTLRVAFEYYWDRSNPVPIVNDERESAAATLRGRKRTNNGQTSRSAK
jgi:sugar-specific transcriptional regulator TrmB